MITKYFAPRNLLWIFWTIWACPITLLALPYLICCGPTQMTIGHGVMLVKVKRLLTFGQRASAQGPAWPIVLVRQERWPLGPDQGLFKHEREHTQQAKRLGPFWPLAYGLGSLVAWLAGTRWYQDNPFELAARRAGGQVE